MHSADFFEPILSIAWFQNCGAPVDMKGFATTDSVQSWREAIACCSTPEWENTTLDARNDLTVCLQKRGALAAGEWNRVTAYFKAQCIEPLTQSVWQPFAANTKLPDVFVHDVQWNVLAALMEMHFVHVKNLPTFFRRLLGVYREGHFPCGWTGGAYPAGTLLVY